MTEPIKTRGLVGQRLRVKREELGFSIPEAALATKIADYYLQALESDDWERIPGEAYRKGFLRNYANFLHLDAAALLRDYGVEPPKPPPDYEESENVGRVLLPPPKSSPPFLFPALAVLFFLAAGGAVYFYLNSAGSLSSLVPSALVDEKEPLEDGSRAVPSANAPVATEAQSARDPLPVRVAAPEEPTGLEPAPLPVVSAPPTESGPKEGSDAQSAQPDAAGAGPEVSQETQIADSAMQAAPQDPATAAPEISFAGGILSIRALGEAEVTLVIDGRAPRDYQLLKGSALSWKVDRELKLVVSDPTNLEVRLGGALIDFKGEPEWQATFEPR